MRPPIIRVQQDTFDMQSELAALEAALEGARGDVGAVVSFLGVCRDEGGRLEALEIEHYPGMAEEEIGRVAEQAGARWPLAAVLVIHRYGLVRPGEPIVLVAVAASHRASAFAAAEFVMDFLKTRAPFWKRQHFKVGMAAEAACADADGWVEARAADDIAAQRW